MPSRQRGFSLIELLVTLIVFALLAALGIPSMSQYMDNTKIHGTAEVFYASVLNARTEAIRRNALVELIFTTAEPIASQADTTALNANGPNWIVRTFPTAGTSDFIDGKSGSDAAGAVVVTSNNDRILFSPLGALTEPPEDPPVSPPPTPTAAVVNFAAKRGTCEVAGGDARCLRVVVSVGGQARLCDPAATATNDSRKC